MRRFIRVALAPVVVLGTLAFAAPNAAQAGGWSISVGSGGYYSGYGPGCYAPRVYPRSYSAYQFRYGIPYGYSLSYRNPVWNDYRNYGGHGGHHGHRDHHGHHGHGHHGRHH